MDVPAATKSEQGNELPISQASSLDLKAKNSLSISNETKYKINSDSLFSQKFPVRSISLQKQNDSDILPVFSAASPEVLIIHTHGTEGYSDSAFTNYRTCDTSKNVVAVGRKLKSALENQGVAVLHCEEMFDKDSYIKSYSKSFAAVSEYLSKYPSIKYVIDLHRDAVSDGNGGYARLVCKNDGEALAQLMLVIGTDEAGAKHKNWAQNLRVAAEIQKDLFEENSGIVRPINLRKASFNQQLLPGYFILEAGNCGNDLSEVISSMNVFAKSFAKTISSSM
jgi:stage II sporulation protein P